MTWQSKKIISIFFAFLVGATIVFFTWKNVAPQKEAGSLTSVSNEDWRATLNVAPQDDFIKTLSPTGKNIDILAIEATTTTTILGQRLLTEFIASQEKSVDGTISDAEATRISNLLAQEVSTQSERQYTLRDINISQDNSYDANVLYINKVNILTKDLLATDQKEEEEINIVIAAMETGDTILLNKLGIKTSGYQQLIKDLLAVKTPSSLANIHLQLVQTSETLRSATEGLKNTLRDPALGLAALSQYKNGIDNLLFVKQEYRDFYKNY